MTQQNESHKHFEERCWLHRYTVHTISWAVEITYWTKLQLWALLYMLWHDWYPCKISHLIFRRKNILEIPDVYSCDKHGTVIICLVKCVQVYKNQIRENRWSINLNHIWMYICGHTSSNTRSISIFIRKSITYLLIFFALLLAHFQLYHIFVDLFLIVLHTL